MSQISFNTHALNRTDHLARTGTDPVGRRAVQAVPTRTPDRVEVSDAARQAIEDSGTVRLDVVQRVREQLAAGTYETPDKVAIASHEMARALRGQS
jgi:hypothetical protein